MRAGIMGRIGDRVTARGIHLSKRSIRDPHGGKHGTRFERYVASFEDLAVRHLPASLAGVA